MLNPFLQLLIFTLCSIDFAEAVGAKFKLSSWPAADSLFHQDPRFRGGDGAYSIDLGQGRILWLMGDSFIASRDNLRRNNSTMIRNCVAVQDGLNPAKAKMRFTWSYDGTTPASFFKESGMNWFWPGHGTMIGDRLLIFLMKIGPSNSVLGFHSVGWNAVLVENPAEIPRLWNMRLLHGLPNSWNILVGSASVFLNGDYLYAYSAEDTGPRGAYLVRFSRDEAYLGDLSKPHWWDPDRQQWKLQSEIMDKPISLFENAPTEFTIHFSPTMRKWIQFQINGFGGAPIISRSASNMTGPWKKGDLEFYPQEATTQGVLIYAAKAHPALEGSVNLVLTYASNLLDFKKLLEEERFYYPRFLKLQWD